MPEIPLLAGKQPLTPMAIYLIWQAIMLSPKDTDSAESFLDITSGGGALSKLLKNTISRFTKASTGGAIAGEVFLQFLQLKLHRPQDASVAKAVFLVSRDLENKKLRGGRAAPSNVDGVHKFWAKFRPAAHLWGAFRLALDSGQVPLSPASSDSEFAKLNDHLLLGADTLLLAAVKAKLDFDPDPWTLPDAYPKKPFNIAVPPPTAWAIEQLAEYRAPNSPK